MKIKIDVDKVIATMDEAIFELKEGLNPKLLSEDDKKAIQKDLDEVIKLTLKIKLQSQQEKLSEIITAIDKNTLNSNLLNQTTQELEAILSNIKSLNSTLHKAA